MNNSENIASFLSSDFGQQILNKSSDKVIVLGSSYELKYFNPSAQKYSFLYGIKNLELGITMLPKVDTNFWKKAFDKALAGDTLEFKFHYYVREEKYTDLINLFPLITNNKKVEAIALQAKNFSIEPYTTKDILENENLFKNLFETSPVGITIRKLETQELKAFNLKICEMFDCTPEEFESYDRADFVHYEDTEHIQKNMQLLIEGKINSFRLEKQYKKKNGDIFWGVAHRSSFRIGDEMYQMGILEDINQQKKFEARLIQKEAQTQSIFNSTTDKIFAIDKDYNLIDANLSALKILAKYNLGRSYEEVTISDFNFKNYEAWHPYLKRAFRGEAFNFESNYEFEGEDHTDLITVSPLNDKDGNTIGASVYGKEITEIKKIQRALKANEALLLDAERVAKIGHWEFDVAAQIINWSSGVGRIFDLDLDEISILENFYKYVHPEDRGAMKEAIENTINTGEPYEIRKRIINKNGKAIYIIARGEPFIEREVVTKLFGTIQDITDEIEIQNALVDNEAKVRAIFNSTEDKIYAVDRNYRLIDFNESAARSLPRLFELEKFEKGIEVLAQKPSLRQLWIDHYDEALRGKKLLLEKKYEENGLPKLDLVAITPIINDDGEITGAALYGKDITELQNAQKAFQETQIKLEDAQKLAKIGYWKYDAIATNITWSPSILRLMDFEINDYSPTLKDCISFCHPEDISDVTEIIFNSLKDSEAFEVVNRCFTKKGRLIYTRIKGKPEVENGKLVAFEGTMQDITQLKEIEANREQLLSELEKVNEELREFAYIVSHDLKAPLRAINAISQWLSEDYKDVLDERGKNQLQLLGNRVNRMHQFINGIFEYTKLGRTNETKEVVDLNQLIDDVFLMLNLGDDTTIHIPKKLPDLYCEKIKIEQVFLNLISNATKHNDKNVCLLSIEYEDLDTHYLFRVSDNGKGIDEKNFDKIFQIFQTLQSKDDFESTGIGLSIVKKIIQLHEGEILVKSELGKGSTFEFTLKKYIE